MTDPTKCPHCRAEFVCQWSTKTLYTCQTVIDDDSLCSFQSHQCLATERNNLKAKVAAQQELLKEVVACGCSWECSGKYAELQVPLELITNIRKVVEE